MNETRNIASAWQICENKKTETRLIYLTLLDYEYHSLQFPQRILTLYVFKEGSQPANDYESFAKIRHFGLQRIEIETLDGYYELYLVVYMNSIVSLYHLQKYKTKKQVSKYLMSDEWETLRIHRMDQQIILRQTEIKKLNLSLDEYDFESKSETIIDLMKIIEEENWNINLPFILIVPRNFEKGVFVTFCIKINSEEE